jgi:sarcosine oxidase subunit beta
MRETVDVAIVGGGIAGASVAYFLAELGVRNILVLERTSVAAEASSRASGLVTFTVATHPGMAAVLKASSDLYGAWEDRIGGPPVLTRVGGLLPVPAEERETLLREVQVMREAGHTVQILDRADLAALVPAWSLDGWDLAAYSPVSGFIDPPMVTTALMNRARALGVRVYQGTGVMGIATEGDRISSLQTSRGAIAAPVVVIAAGAWSVHFARLARVALDIWPVRHEVVHFQPPPALAWPFPCAADLQHGVYFRPEPGGLVLAANIGPDQPVEDPSRFDPGIHPSYSGAISARLAARIPVMRDAVAVSGHAGVYLSGRDSFPVIGPLPGVEGLYCICDTAGNGMTSSPGLGRALAETIVHGTAYVNLHPFRPARFAENDHLTVGYGHRRHDGSSAL